MKKSVLFYSLFIGIFYLLLTSCENVEHEIPTEKQVPKEIKEKIVNRLKLVDSVMNYFAHQPIDTSELINEYNDSIVFSSNTPGIRRNVSIVDISDYNDTAYSMDYAYPANRELERMLKVDTYIDDYDLLNLKVNESRFLLIGHCIHLKKPDVNFDAGSFENGNGKFVFYLYDFKDEKLIARKYIETQNMLDFITSESNYDAQKELEKQIKTLASDKFEDFVKENYPIVIYYRD